VQPSAPARMSPLGLCRQSPSDSSHRKWLSPRRVERRKINQDKCVGQDRTQNTKSQNVKRPIFAWVTVPLVLRRARRRLQRRSRCAGNTCFDRLAHRELRSLIGTTSHDRTALLSGLCINVRTSCKLFSARMIQIRSVPETWHQRSPRRAANVDCRDITSAVGRRIAALAKVLSSLVDDIPCVGGRRVRPFLGR
jgi:hypothetical protein